ncbi:MAG: NTP transferase domain-containing protein [Desulfobacterota bacterium]|nr:NTP transferase domain-containing protein [Thermodesulfobacteriota bacterium]
MQINAIIQARMGSRRFPAKVMHEICGMPVLGYVIERVCRCHTISKVIVATSDDPLDDTIERYCQKQGITCFRGARDKVSARFAAALQHYPCDGFIRVCADSPLLDSLLVDRAVKMFSESPCDMVTNIMPRTYPRGQSVEVLKTDVFLATQADFTEPDDYEHVTRYFYRHPEQFAIYPFLSPVDLSTIRLCIDTYDDMEHVTALITMMKKPQWSYSLSEILELYHRINGGNAEGCVASACST